MLKTPSITPALPQARQDAPELRSRLVQVLNVAERLRLRLGLPLRPCWRSFWAAAIAATFLMP